MAPLISRDDGDWLASLARQSTSADIKKKPNNTSKRKRKGSGGKKNDPGTGNNGDDATGGVSPLTKAQRIERREQKKNQREERKRLNEEARQNRLDKKRQKVNHGARPATASTPASTGERAHPVPEKIGKRGMTALSKKALTHLSTSLDSTVSTHQEAAANTPQPKRRKKKQQDEPIVEESLANGLPAEPKGKATKQSTLRPDSKELQPRIRDYNGQGLVRPSLYLPFDDPSYVPKVELEFEEHVPGFFGKSKQKAAKKQADANMLWKRCLKAKEEDTKEGNGGGGGKKRKKKGKGPSDKLEGMIRQGVM